MARAASTASNLSLLDCVGEKAQNLWNLPWWGWSTGSMTFTSQAGLSSLFYRICSKIAPSVLSILRHSQFTAGCMIQQPSPGSAPKICTPRLIYSSLLPSMEPTCQRLFCHTLPSKTSSKQCTGIYHPKFRFMILPPLYLAVSVFLSSHHYFFCNPPVHSFPWCLSQVSSTLLFHEPCPDKEKRIDRHYILASYSLFWENLVPYAECREERREEPKSKKGKKNKLQSR